MPSVLELFVQASLPTSAKYGLENFAGDPHVKVYLDSLTSGHDLDLEVYVAWESPPDVQVIAGQTESALVRSERLDTFLAEFQRMQQIQPLLGGDLADDLVRSALLRWMAEMLIGYRQPALAMDALAARPHLPGIETDIHIPFRDESLAALPEIERCALQCFCLGHEVGHLATQLDTELSLETPVDGVSLLSHIDYEHRAANKPENEIEMYRLCGTGLCRT